MPRRAISPTALQRLPLPVPTVRLGGGWTICRKTSSASPPAHFLQHASHVPRADPATCVCGLVCATCRADGLPLGSVNDVAPTRCGAMLFVGCGTRRWVSCVDAAKTLQWERRAVYQNYAATVHRCLRRFPVMARGLRPGVDQLELTNDFKVTLARMDLCRDNFGVGGWWHVMVFYARLGRARQAEALLQRLTDDGVVFQGAFVSHSTRFWALLLLAYKNCRDVKGLHGALERMERRGVALDDRAYCTLIAGGGGSEIGKVLMDHMRSQGMQPCVYHYNALLAATAGELRRKRLSAKTRIEQPSPAPESSSTNGDVRGTSLTFGLELVAAAAGEGLQPNERTAAQLMSLVGSLVDAEWLVEHVATAPVFAAVDLGVDWYNSLQQKYAELGAAHRIDDVFLAAVHRERGLPRARVPAATYSMFIHGKCIAPTHADLPVVEEVFRGAVLRHPHHAPLYTSMLRFYIALGNRGGAKNLRSRMNITRQRPEPRFSELYESFMRTVPR